MPPKTGSRPGSKALAARPKVGRQGTRTAIAKSAGRRASPRAACEGALYGETRAEIESSMQSMFVLADTNNSGTIEYSEFLKHHKSLMTFAAELLEHSVAPLAMDASALSELFRANDVDHSLHLDKEEYIKYLEGVLSLVGPREFLRATTSYIDEEKQQRRLAHEGFDRGATAMLLQKLLDVTKVENESRKKCEQLLASKADPNYTDPSGQFALMVAAEKADVAFMRKLLEANGDHMKMDSMMECAVFKAVRMRNMSVVEMLLVHTLQHDEEVRLRTATKSRGPSPRPNEEGEATSETRRRLSSELVRNIDKLEANEVKDLIVQNADVNFKDSNGWTPLTAAAFWEKKDTAAMILRTKSTFNSQRLDVDGHNSKGRCALHIAARKGNEEFVRILIAANADPDRQDPQGWTALHFAVFNADDDVVQALVDCKASVVVQARNGMTPWMVASKESGMLKKSTMALLEPSELVKFGPKVIPTLNDTSLTPYGKLQKLMELPGINCNPANLRLYEQCFQGAAGPSKVRLQKLWENLAEPLLGRLRSGETELEAPAPHLDEKVRVELELDIKSRQQEQKLFLAQWLLDTKGPRRSPEWHHDNRAFYAEDFQRKVSEELEKFREDADSLRDKIVEQDGGAELVALPAEEVKEPRYLNQCGAHPIPAWLETLDVAGVFEVMRLLGAKGMGKDDHDSTMNFADMVTTNHYFSTGRNFWRNIYKYYLILQAKMLDQEFQHTVKAMAENFTEEHEGDGLSATYCVGQVKTMERLMAKEKQFGDPSPDTFAGRTVAAKALDIMRCTVSLNSPRALVRFYEEQFKSKQHGLKLVQTVNYFNPDATDVGLMGQRMVKMNVLLNGGVRQSNCGRAGAAVQVALVAEVRLMLEEFTTLYERRELLVRCARGDFDWNPEDCDEGEVDLDDQIDT